MARVMSGYLVNTTWISELDTDQLNVAVLDETRESFDLLREDLRSVGGGVRSPIEPRLESFVKDLNFTQVPILMLLAQVVGIALFYVVIVSGVQVAERREELFSMRSRGASIVQVISHTAIEGILLAIIAARGRSVHRHGRDWATGVHAGVRIVDRRPHNPDHADGHGIPAVGGGGDRGCVVHTGAAGDREPYAGPCRNGCVTSHGRPVPTRCNATSWMSRWCWSRSA